MSFRISLAACACIGFAIVAGLPGLAQVETFTPITDAELQNPEPADWLNWRRTLDGWGYSPLDQIDRANVGEWQLAWSWGLEPGVSQTTPIVHDGIPVRLESRSRHPRAPTRAPATSSGSIATTWRRASVQARRCAALRSTTTSSS